MWMWKHGGQILPLVCGANTAFSVKGQILSLVCGANTTFSVEGQILPLVWGQILPLVDSHRVLVMSAGRLQLKSLTAALK